MTQSIAARRLNEECDRYFRDIYKGAPKILVFGEGATPCDILLVGEAPGEQETLQLRPFVGKAGKNLDQFLERLRLRRSSLYITNAVKFRPVKVGPSGRTSNRPPTSEEIALFTPWLEREIALVAPRYIVTLGNVALRCVSGRAMPIGQVHGQPMPRGDAKLFPLYHPASVIYNRSLAATYLADLDLLAALLDADGYDRSGGPAPGEIDRE